MRILANVVGVSLLTSGTRSAMAALIGLYAAEGPDAWIYTQPLFSKLNEILEGRKIPVIETLLVTVGLVGR